MGWGWDCWGLWAAGQLETRPEDASQEAVEERRRDDCKTMVSTLSSTCLRRWLWVRWRSTLRIEYSTVPYSEQSQSVQFPEGAFPKIRIKFNQITHCCYPLRESPSSRSHSSFVFIAFTPKPRLSIGLLHPHKPKSCLSKLLLAATSFNLPFPVYKAIPFPSLTFPL